MLSPELGKIAFQIGIFLTVIPGLLLLALEPGTAEFVITVITFVLGTVFTLLIVVLVRISTRRR